ALKSSVVLPAMPPPPPSTISLSDRQSYRALHAKLVTDRVAIVYSPEKRCCAGKPRRQREQSSIPALSRRPMPSISAVRVTAPTGTSSYRVSQAKPTYALSLIAWKRADAGKQRVIPA